MTFVNAVTGPSEDETAVGRISGESEEKRGRRKRKRTKYVHFSTFHPHHLCSTSLMTISPLQYTVTYSKALTVQLGWVLCKRSYWVSDNASFCYRCFLWTVVHLWHWRVWTYTRCVIMWALDQSAVVTGIFSQYLLISLILHLSGILSSSS